MMENLYINGELVTELVVPNSVTIIGGSAFSGCSGLTSITLPFIGGTRADRNNYYLGYIFGAPKYQDNETKVPANLKTVVVTDDQIANYAFYNCKTIEKIVLPSSLKTIGESVFFECNKLKDLEIPSSVTTIKKRAFMWCGALAKIEIPSSVSTIEMEAFWGSGLTEVNLPEGITKIASYTFCNCSKLVKVTMPDSVTEIDSWVFNDCRNLREVNFSKNLVRIGGYAFENCWSLESVV